MSRCWQLGQRRKSCSIGCWQLGQADLAELAHPQVRRFDLQLALVCVLEKLRRADNRINRGADVGEKGGDRRAGDEEWIGDAPLGVE